MNIRYRVTLTVEERHQLRTILSRLEFHFTPKHASWLNMVEIGVMVRQCLNHRIPYKATLIREIAAWERRRSAEQARIEWLFTMDLRSRSSAVSIRSPSPTPPRRRLEPVRTSAAR